jgi:hypothetical protein
MDQLPVCPECGSAELRETTRVIDSQPEVKVMV